MNTQLGIPALKALAEAATPGPWEHDGRYIANAAMIVLQAEGCWNDCCRDPDTAKDLAYIAAANPATVLALIARIEELEKSK